ncbi:hypothetical protein SUGI_0385260 [Cryptomeria japonica]|nr:hypothetical protein SUGI_0385260 [Cryptomeria japonica]
MFLIFQYLYKKNFKHTIRNPGMSEEYANRWIHQLKQLNHHTTTAGLRIFSNDTNRNIAQGKCASCMLYCLFAEERQDEDRGQYANFPMPMRHSAIWIMQTPYPKASFGVSLQKLIVFIKVSCGFSTVLNFESCSKKNYWMW